MRRVLAPLLVLLAFLAVAPVARADRTFSTRFAADEFGDMTIVGNTLVTCASADSGCAGAQAGTASSRLRNNDHDMVAVNADAAAGLGNSSSSTLSLPAGAQVLFAGLYWGADTTVGTIPSGATGPTPTGGNLGLAGAVSLKVPGASSYQSLTAANLDTWNASTLAGRYGAFVDVTSQVAAAGSGTYWVGGAQLATGGDRYGAWSLVVAYKAGSVERNLRISDGLVTVASSTATIPVNGLNIPSGSPGARFGLVSYEGDKGSTGDTATLGSTALTNGANPSNDVFNSSHTNLGTRYSAKTPDYVNALGADWDVFDMSGVLAPGTTSANLNLTSTGDVYAPAVIATAIDRAPAAPSAEIDPSVSGTAADGSTLTAARGTWNGTPTIAYAYQWQRCDTGGASCAAITGATASTYTLTSADVGSTVRVAVNASNSLGTGTATSAVTATVAATPPVNTVVPAVTGTARDGQTLTSGPGTWTGTTPMTRATKWQRCDGTGAGCADIAGATAATYALVAADVGNTVRSVVTMTNTAGSASAASAPSAVVVAAPPVNTVLPAVSGTATDGQTLTGGLGTWTGTATISYARQWRRCDTSGANCVDIAGATGTTYTLTSADVGARIVEKVTATNSVGTANASSVPTATIAATPPVNTVVPPVSGTTTSGQTLTAGPGTWTGTTPMTRATKWQRCDTSGSSCVDIAGATSATYALVNADVGATVRAVVTMTNAAGSASASSAASAVIAGIAPANTVAPPLSGSAREGQTLSAADGTWTGSTPMTRTTKWQRCNSAGAACADIAGATAATYTLAAADLGATVRAVVTMTNSAGAASANSAVSAVVAAGPPVNTVLPAISGTLRDGQTLTSTLGTWTGTATITYARQWQRCDATGSGCTDIAGATAATYVLTPADADRTVRIRVTATNSVGSATAASPTSALVAAIAPANTVAPQVSGTAVDGSTLTSSTGTWSGTAPLTYAYRWQRCDGTGATCTDIAGATAATYVLQGGDVASRVRVRVTATNSAGQAVAAATPTTAVAAVAPANLVAPVVTGARRVGSTLTTDDGTWRGTGPLAYSYQWQRCDAAGACVAIAGATARTYTLTEADTGATVRAVVTAANAVGAASANAATAGTTTAGPTLRTPPVISGTLLPGETVTATPGTWRADSALGYRYQWLRCDATGAGCTPIPGATSSSYRLQDADSGAVVKVSVTATDAEGRASAPASTLATDLASGATVVSDLGALPGSLVSPSGCATPTSALIARSTRLPGVRGKVKLALRASGAAITPATPLRLVATAPARSIRSMRVTVDGKRLKGTKIAPALVAGGRTHTIVAKLRARRGVTRTLRMLLTTARCGPVFTTSAKRGARTRTVLLRVDSRQALTAIRYRVSPAMAKALRTGRGRHRGGLQVTSRGAKAKWARGVWKLGAGKGGVLLAATGAPRVTLSGRTVTVTGLPAATGIVTVSVPVRTRVSGRFQARATLSGNRTAKLRSRIRVGRRR